MRWQSRACPAGLATCLMLAAGCASYESKPLDLDAHRESFLSRDASGESLAGYAEYLRTQGDAPERFDVSDGIGLEEAEVIALVFNSELRLARLRAGVVAATAENAGLWQDPVFGADFTRITESVAHPWKSFLSLGITIPISGRLEIEKKRANAEADAELERLVLAEWEARVELRRRWVTWTSATRRCEVMGDFLGRLDEVLVIVNKNEEAGEMPRIEARLFRLERASRAYALGNFEAERDAALLAIKHSMGLSPAAEVRIVADAVAAASLRESDAVRAAIDSGDSQRLLVALASYETAERQLQLEVRKQYPDIVIGPGYGREDGQDQLLLGVSMPLPIWNRNQQAVAEASAQRDVARGVFEDEYERLVSELALAEVALRKAIGQRELLEQTIVPMVDEQYTDARKVASLGEVNTLVMLETITRQQEAKLALIDSISAEMLARIEVDALAGPANVRVSTEGASR